jgi:hypothetical protein
LSHAHGEDRYAVYREALRRRVCAICLDGADDGGCGLGTPMRCPVDEHLVTLVDLIQELRARGDHRYAAAVELRVCARCPQREASGRCASRDDGRCALSVFLPLVVEAIDEAEHGPRDANA